MRIFKQNRNWFLDEEGEVIHLSPSDQLWDGIWQGVAKMLDVYTDDAGANPDRCIEFYRQASKLFAGASVIAADKAVDLQNKLDLDRLYKDDDSDEPWWNR